MITSFVSNRLVTLIDDYPVPSDQLRNRLDPLAGSFLYKDSTAHPFIYPCVTGYDMAPGHGCTALNEDGTCRLHADKPEMCRSIPFDPILPEAAQARKISEFKKYGCMVETNDIASENLIFSGNRITDAQYKADYDRRYDAMKRDNILSQLVSLLGEDEIGQIGRKLSLPRMDEFLRITERGAYIETSMVPFLILFVSRYPEQKPRVLDYIAAQLQLIRPAIETAIRERRGAHRERTQTMREYISAYEWAAAAI